MQRINTVAINPVLSNTLAINNSDLANSSLIACRREIRAKK